MSNTSSVTNRDEIDIYINSTFRKRLNGFMYRLGTWCCCSRKQEHNTLPVVPAVDSVRLVYMRRIEEVSLMSVRAQQEGNNHRDGINQGTQTRNVNQRRIRQKLPTIIALEKALKEYELKHKSIIIKTRMPESVSFDKTFQISRGSQTDTIEVIEELLKAVNEMKIKESSTTSESIKHVTLYNLDEDDDDDEDISTINADVESQTTPEKRLAENYKALESNKPILHSI